MHSSNSPVLGATFRSKRPRIATKSDRSSSFCNTQRLAALPAATPITGTSLCLVPSTEYAPRWDAPGNGSTTLTATDCARACEADPVCTGATYVSGGAELNCWFKDWGQGPVPPPCLPNANSTLEVQSIFDPAGEECSSITYSGNAVYACDDEAQIHDQPTGVASGSASSNNLESGLSFIKYDRFPGRDYIPGAPKSVSIQVLLCWVFPRLFASRESSFLVILVDIGHFSIVEHAESPITCPKQSYKVQSFPAPSTGVRPQQWS